MTDADLRDWSEKYRPRKVADTILPDRIKAKFQEYVDQKNVQNMILAGSSGVGKTTVATAMCDEMGIDWLMINGSDDNGIDMLRTKVRSFASSMSMDGNRKVIIIDEADYLSPNAQAAFRGAMQEFATNCSFIFTANYASRLIEPLHSRAPVISFKLQSDEKAKMAGAFLARVKKILDTEKVKYSEKVLVEFITKFFPDYRRILNELERYAKEGQIIDVGILTDVIEREIKNVFTFLKNKDFASMRKWLAKNADIDHTMLYRALYDALEKSMKPASIPVAVILIADYQDKLGRAADAEIVTAGLLTELMVNGEFL